MDTPLSRLEKLVVRADMMLASVLLPVGTIGSLAALTASDGGPAPAFYLIVSPLIAAVGLGFWGAGSLMRRRAAWRWVAQIVLPIAAPIVVWPALGMVG
jgi:hypothetical protein